MRVAIGTAVLITLAGSTLASENRGWANYKHLRRDGAAAPQVSALPPIDGATIDKSVQQTIKSDIQAVIAEFSGLPENVSNVVKTALGKIMSQSIYQQSPDQQLATISTAINNKFDQIQSSVASTLANLTDITDASNLDVLKDCINTVVAAGGLKNAGDGTCLTTSNYSLASLQSQFNTFVDQNTFLAPADKINEATQAINDYLNNATLVPSTAALISASAAALQNVVDTTSALDRDATEKSFSCFLNALQTISDVPIQERQVQCAQGNGNVTGSALADIEQAYQATVNQYAGALPPTLATQVQRIGMESLSLNIGAYDNSTRNSINTAILSAVSATSGESATIVGSLIDCLNTIYDDTPNNTCNPNSDPDVLEHNANIYRNYLAQFVSTLPKVLVQDLNNTVQAQLGSDDGPQADQLRAQLQADFDNASLGTEYEACEDSFIDCTIAAAVNGSASTSCYESKGAACQALPTMSPSGLDDSADPYNAIATGLAGDGSWGGARRRHVKKSNRKVWRRA